MGYVLVTRGKTWLVLASGIGLCETDVVDGCGGLGETDGVKEILWEADVDGWQEEWEVEIGLGLVELGLGV